MKSKEFALESKRSKIKMPKHRDPNWQTMQAKATSGAAGEHKDRKRADKQGEVKHKKDLVPMEDVFKESEDSSVDEVVAFAPGYGSSSIKKPNAPRRKTSSMLAIMQAINKKEQEKQKTKDSDKDKRMGEDNTQELYGLRIGDTVTTELDGQQVQGDIIDIFPDDMEVELLLRGPEAGRTVVVDVRDTEIVEGTDFFDKFGLPIMPDDGKFRDMMRGIKRGTKKQASADRREREAESRRRARDAFGPSPADKLSIRSDKGVAEGSDWGEPREILEDVLQTLEREVEWPLTEVMDPKEVRQLLSPLVRAVNDKLLSIDEGWNDQDDWGSMSHREFKRRELEHELAGEEERYHRVMKGDWYLRIDGKVWKKGGEPVTFKGKEAARKAGMTILGKNPGKKITVVNQPIDESSEISLESRIDELKRGSGFLILKFREKELPDNEGKYLIGYGGFGETPDDVRLATAVIKEFKAEKFEDMRRKIFDLFKDKSFVGVEKIKINAPTSLINRYPELEKLFSAAESGEFKKVEPIFSEPKEIVSKKTEKYRIDPVTGKRERIKEPIKYGRGMSGRPGEPGEPTVRFSITNPRLASMMKDQGMQFNQGKFTVSQSVYKKLLDALRDAEMIRKFGDVTSLIKDKEIIENDETV